MSLTALTKFQDINLPGGRLERLKQKLKEQRKHMNELDKHLYGSWGFPHEANTNRLQ